MIPQRNATLTAVTGGGYSEDFGATPGAGTVRWEGRVPAYLSERTERETAGTSRDVWLRRTLIVSARLPFTWQVGDTATVTFDGTDSALKVRAIARHLLPGAGQAATTRLEVEDA